MQSLDKVQEKKARPWIGVMILSFATFILLGIPDAMRGVAWPSIQSDFALQLDSISALLIAGTTGYVIASFFSSYLLRKWSIVILLALGTIALAVSQFVYAASNFWEIIVLSTFIGGLGAGSIDAGLNTFIAQNFPPSIMQWLHGFFGVGATIGPIIMTLSISWFTNWRPGYILVGAIHVLLALLLIITRPKWRLQLRSTPTESTSSSPGTAGNPADDRPPSATIGKVLRNPKAILSAFLFFLYSGLELGLGTWGYTLLTQSRGFDLTTAGLIAGGYWATFTVGRMLAGLYTRWLSVQRVVLIGLIAAGFGMVFVLVDYADWLTVLGIGLTGFAIAPIFAALVSDTRNRVGSDQAAVTISLQVAAAGVGAAIMPSFAGILARNFSLEVIPLFTLVTALLLIACFLLSHRLGRQPTALR